MSLAWICRDPAKAEVRKDFLLPLMSVAQLWHRHTLTRDTLLCKTEMHVQDVLMARESWDNFSALLANWERTREQQGVEGS